MPTFRKGEVTAVASMSEDAPASTKPASRSEVWAFETAGDQQAGILWKWTLPVTGC